MFSMHPIFEVHATKKGGLLFKRILVDYNIVIIIDIIYLRIFLSLKFGLKQSGMYLIYPILLYLNLAIFDTSR